MLNQVARVGNNLNQIAHKANADGIRSIAIEAARLLGPVESTAQQTNSTMIGKTSIGRSFKGCCAYNMQKVEMGKGEILLSQGVRDFDQQAMVADFVRQAQMNPDLSRSVWHTAISFDPQDEARTIG